MARGKRGEAKRAAIIEAFIDSVIAVGFDATSMGEVAVRVGLDRSTLHFYFRTREELTIAAANRIAEIYVERLRAVVAEFGPLRRAHKLVDHLFGPQFHQADLSIAIEEFSTAGNRIPAIERKVAGIYRAIETIVVDEVDKSYPRANSAERRDVAYAIVQLSEGFTVFLCLGFGVNRGRAAKRAAHMLLSTLESK